MPLGAPRTFAQGDAMDLFESGSCSIDFGGCTERLGYVSLFGEQVFLAHHQRRSSTSPSAGASILLCGPIGAERERSHRTIVELARFLARRGFDCYRFDYLGIGESSGRFDGQDFSAWRRQIVALVERIRSTEQTGVVGLWGVRVGALLASEAFAAGCGDGGFFCCALDGRPILVDIARRSLVASMIASSQAVGAFNKEATKSRSTTDTLGSGGAVSVDGYLWTPRLWSDAAEHRVQVPNEHERRAWSIVELRPPRSGANDSSIVELRTPQGRVILESERFWESSPHLIPRGTILADATARWALSLCEEVVSS